MDYKFKKAVIELNIEVIKKGYIKKFGVASNSMKFLISKGDFVSVKKVPDRRLIKKGDIVVFKESSGHKLIVHRVVDKKLVNNRYIFFTRGDFNIKRDLEAKTEEDIIGKVFFLKKYGVKINLENRFYRIMEKIIFVFSRIFVLLKHIDKIVIFKKTFKQLIKKNYLLYFSYYNEIYDWEDNILFFEKIKDKYSERFKKVAEIEVIGGYSELGFSFIKDNRSVKLINIEDLKSCGYFDFIICNGILGFFKKNEMLGFLNRIYEKMSRKSLLYIVEFKYLKAILRKIKKLGFEIVEKNRNSNFFAFLLEKK